MNMIDTDGIGRVANIEQALVILEALSGHPTGITIADLSSNLEIPKSALSRILATLARQSYVAKDKETAKFRLSYKFIALALRQLDAMGIDDLCGPLLRSLADLTGEMVQLAMVDGDDIRYVARADSLAQVRVISILGKKILLHAYAAGKVWLASLEPEKALQLALAAGLSKPTKQTIGSVKDLQKELNAVRNQGFALNLEEVDEGVNSIAVPIRAKSELVSGALTLTGPAYRLPKTKLEKLLPALQRTARELGEILPMIHR
jgi:IclR family transcriptional regulator, acetate operon repressor